MQDVFRVRLNCIDHYQATPTKYDPRLRNDSRASQLSGGPKVPVIRVFGSTETGQKVCAHIHGAFPYLFIEYPSGSLRAEDVGAFLYTLHLSIDRALAISYRRDARAGGEQAKFVARITLVKGIPFYGFQVGYRFYCKIYMHNSAVMARVADLLHQGVILRRKFQPYEAHLQYLLQFMTDYNLYGCGYLEAGKVTFRYPVPKQSYEEEAPHLWHSQSIFPAQITDDISLPRVSHCSIEVDICVQDILNRKEVKERRLHHDFVERLNPLPPDMKLVHSMAGLWKDETKRRKRRMQLSDSTSSPFAPEALVSMSADPRDSQPQGWLHEEEFREEMRELIAAESANVEADVSFDTFVKQNPLESTIRTVLESVEDLYPRNLKSSLRTSSQEFLEDDELGPSSSIEVDEKGVLGIGSTMSDDGLFPYDSDEELARDAERFEQSLKKNNGNKDSRQQLGDSVPNLQLSRSSQKSSRRLNTANPDAGRTANNVCSSSKPSANQLVGVCASGLLGGNDPDIPITDELIDATKEEGLMSEFPSSKSSGEEENRAEFGTPIRTSTKRSLHSVSDEELAKRPRLSRQAVNELRPASSPHDLPPSPQQPIVTPGDWALPPSYQPQPRKSAMKGESSQRTGSHTLNFAVVKDPDDPETLLRLSQPDSSQVSEVDTAKKHVTFDSSLLLTDDDLWPSQPLSDSQAPHVSLSGSDASPIKGSAQSPLSVSVDTDHDPDSDSDLDPDPYSDTRAYVMRDPPPTIDEVCSTFADHGLPDIIYQDAFYSKEKGVPPRMREFAGRQFRLLGNTLPYLPDFDGDGQSLASFGLNVQVAPDKAKMQAEYDKKRRECSLTSWEMAEPSPTFDEVSEWWEEKEQQRKQKSESGLANPGGASRRLFSPPSTQLAREYQSQIEAATPRNKHGFKYSPKKKSSGVQHEVQYMSTMSLELHVNTRGKLVPNPEEDEVKCIFWCVKSDEHGPESSQSPSGVQSGVIILSENGTLAERVRKQITGELLEEASELDVMVRMVEMVRTHDPDILTGYEVHGSSWGYLIERARLKYDYNLCDEFSRVKSQSHGRAGKEADRWGFNTTSTIRVTGRHMINIWRAMRGELNLLQYTMENVVWHLLHRRIPHYSCQTLTAWYKNSSGNPERRHGDLSKLLRYYQTRTRLDIEVLEENELVSRTSEQARLLGVDFFSVFSRGSQFKVESIMFRIAKPENLVLVSPSRKQVGGQNALECLPLVMEPQSGLYTSPVLVLDFQSLYPSVMIAYNYCYSTFLGRIVDWRGTNKMGFTEYKRRQGLLALLREHVNIAPNGVMYAKPEIRRSLLAKMLTEILETRVMVKSGMKQDKEDRALQQLLNNRQLALKLLANVTYGYTSASFSGRLPCSEIADSIVQTGRETLERSIAFIHSVEKWGAEVVYGDTDSLFVHLKGRTKDQAFEIGREMVGAITDMNPRPIKLRFEKVYLPCVLLAKKRYVGYKYETPDQLVPDFDAKGIETVRRDGTPAEQKIEEKALKLLFDTADLSRVKEYFQRQCRKIMLGRVSVQDFCFAREVKLGTYSGKAGVAPPPGALISTRRMLEDARAEPQYGERVPYVVVSGAPGARLVDRCVPPEDLLAAGSNMRLDAEYYISKNIVPPLERIFNLVGAHVRGWYDEVPKVHRLGRVDPGPDGDGTAAGRPKKVTLESYLQPASCVVCDVRVRPKPNPKPKPMPMPAPRAVPQFGFGYGFFAVGGNQSRLNWNGSNGHSGNSRNRPANNNGSRSSTNNNNKNANNNLPLCASCAGSPAASLATLHGRLNRERERLEEVLRVCRSCAGLAPSEGVDCDSKDCPVLYTRVKQAARVRAESQVVRPAVQRLEGGVEGGMLRAAAAAAKRPRRRKKAGEKGGGGGARKKKKGEEAVFGSGRLTELEW